MSWMFSKAQRKSTSMVYPKSVLFAAKFLHQETKNQPKGFAHTHVEEQIKQSSRINIALFAAFSSFQSAQVISAAQGLAEQSTGFLGVKWTQWLMFARGLRFFVAVQSLDVLGTKQTKLQAFWGIRFGSLNHTLSHILNLACLGKTMGKELTHGA